MPNDHDEHDRDERAADHCKKCFERTDLDSYGRAPFQQRAAVTKRAARRIDYALTARNLESGQDQIVERQRQACQISAGDRVPRRRLNADDVSSPGERGTGLEPATACLEGRYSTN